MVRLRAAQQGFQILAADRLLAPEQERHVHLLLEAAAEEHMVRLRAVQQRSAEAAAADARFKELQHLEEVRPGPRLWGVSSGLEAEMRFLLEDAGARQPAGADSLTDASDIPAKLLQRHVLKSTLFLNRCSSVQISAP
jgi:hypothetical protein